MSDPSPPFSSFECAAEESSKLLEELEHLKKENSYLRSRVRYLESGRSKCKTSKWSKVKGALGWEKDKDDKEISQMLTVPERVPSDPSSSFSVSPAGSCLSHSSLTTPPPPLSSSSSEEDVRHRVGRRCTLISDGERRKKNEDNRRSKSLDGDSVLPIKDHVDKISSTKTTITKGNKTPWSKVKGMINTKAVRKRSTHEERWSHFSLLNEGGEPEEHSMDEELCGGTSSLTTPKLTVTLPSNEELSTESGSRKPGRLDSPNKLEQNGELSPGLSRKSKWFKVRNVFLQGSRSAPSSPVQSASFTYDLDGDDLSSGDILEKEEDVFTDEDHLRYEIEASYVELQNKLEDELSKKYCREVNLSPEFKKKLEEWDKIKLQGGNVPSKEWDHEKERKKKDRWTKGPEKESERGEDDRNKKPHSREGSFKKHQSYQGARQEVLIPTSTGTFRFEGISDNFTRKLYEWEQARGIAPEESTFALLGPEYQPAHYHRDENENGGLTRSKSIGSIADLTMGQSLAQQPSSLSLNDMNEISHCNHITTATKIKEADEGGTISREPLFCTSFAPEDDARMVDSSSSSDEKEGLNSLFRSQVLSSSYQLLQDNITLLDKLKKERDVCRQLEDDMKTLEGQINNVSKSFTVEVDHHSCDSIDHSGRINGFEYEMDHCYGSEHLDSIADLPGPPYQCRRPSPLREYTIRLEDFKRVQATLFDDEATQTNYDDEEGLGYHRCNDFNVGYDDRQQSASIRKIIGELQDLTERMGLAAVEADRETFRNIRNELCQKESGLPCACQSHSDNKLFSTYTLPSYWLRGRRNQELSSLSKLINEKILELKQTFNCMTSSTVKSEFTSPPPMTRGLHRSMAQEDLSPGEVNPGEYGPPSRTSSSASSISYLASHASSSSRLHHDWSSPFSFQHHLSCGCDQPSLVAEHNLSDSYTGATSEGDLSESGLRINTLNVFVPTMRKIFSPVSDSEAVGVIIAEEDEGVEIEKRCEENYEDVDEDQEEETDVEDVDEDITTEEFRETEEILLEHVNSNPDDRIDSTIQEVEEINAEQVSCVRLIPSIRLRAKSSSPAVGRKTPKFSSVCYFPVSENGVVNYDFDPPKVEELKLGDELTSSLKMRALRIKRAKEEFLSGEKVRHGSLSVVVNEDIILQSKPNGLMVKSASEEIISERTTEAPREGNHGIETNLKEKLSFLSMIKSKRRTSRDKSAVATLAWNSVSLMSADTSSSSQSCPTTPVLDKKGESTAASWIKNPARMIFRPKGKYTITNQ